MTWLAMASGWTATMAIGTQHGGVGEEAFGSGPWVAEVLHELRSPLGGILALTELLERTPLTAEQARLVAGLRASAEHLRAVASDVLDEARLTTATTVLEHATFDLRGLIVEVAGAAEARAAVKGLSFTLDADPALPTLMAGDRRRLRQMLENLLDNAVKVTERGTIALQANAVAASDTGSRVRFAVLDNGPGLPPDAEARLFRPFGRLDGRMPGTGLGLHLVRRFAELMGGSVGCGSRPEGGARFWIEIDLGRVVAGSHPVAPAPDAPSRQGPLSILVVDDSHPSRLVLEAIFTQLGHRTAAVESAEAALDRLGAGGFDLVTLDRNLPGMDGLALARLLRSDPAHQALAVMAISGHTGPRDREAFAEAGVRAFVAKPVSAQALVKALREVQDHRAAA